jgi:hypothetical protein
MTVAVMLAASGALYIRLRWRRSPRAYRAMIGLTALYFIAGSIVGAWVLHLIALTPNAPASTAPSLEPNSNAPFSIPALHFDSAHAALPDPKLTPGDVLVATRDDVCTPGWASEHRHVTESVRERVFAEYGRRKGPGCCEVDHLVPLELGGSDDIKNLWPQPDDPRPGDREKDQLENTLHELVCKDEISLADAQKCIASNWVACWEKYVVPKYGAEWAAVNRHGW